MDLGSSSTQVELAPDQMKGGTHSGEVDLRIPDPEPEPAMLVVTFNSFVDDISCHPPSFAGRTELDVLDEPGGTESNVLMRTDTLTSDEL